MARLTASVVFPTPPFTFPIARIVAFRPRFDNGLEAFSYTGDIASLSLISKGSRPHTLKYSAIGIHSQICRR